MIILSIILIVLIACFGGVLLFGAPYLPTLRPQIQAALELAELKSGDTLLELGSGDGKVLVAAARQGINVVGYELNPLLVAFSWLRTRKYRNKVRIIWGDYWQNDWPEHQAIFTFLLPRYMTKLDKKVIQSKHKPVKLVSFAFEVPHRPAEAERGGVFLYVYR
jgi:16S rRNA A1518/A1519 N6-dimethyltransferase RsmA/KsgA/DIM1 with predicted DNA glycosylase/AP lyase activity